jgi:hypothetical protein
MVRLSDGEWSELWDGRACDNTGAEDIRTHLDLVTPVVAGAIATYAAGSMLRHRA